MSFLDGMTADDLDQIFFKKNELVKFLCTSAFENSEKRYLKLECQVLTTENEGKLYDMFISNREHPVSKKILAQFLKAFWSRDELNSIFSNGGELPCDLLIGKTFTARASAVNEKDGNRYQSFAAFTNLSVSETANMDVF